MDNIFKYFDKRLGDLDESDRLKNCGPIITISRQTGCDALATGNRLVELLNNQFNTTRWHCVDKQVLSSAASMLKTDIAKVESYLEGSEFKGISEMVMAISGDFISDLSIRKAISDVVKSICYEGYAVLVGRGGVSITRGIEKALHIRLVAPFYWRVENVINKRKYDIETAEEFVVDTDEKRHNIILNFLEKSPLNIDYLFDATLNRSSYNVNQLAELILQLYTCRLEKVKEERKNPKSNLNSIYS